MKFKVKPWRNSDEMFRTATVQFLNWARKIGISQAKGRELRRDGVSAAK